MTYSSRAVWFILGVALSIVLSADSAFAGEEAKHVHIGERILREQMDRGMAGSATFRWLVAQLESSPIQVFVKCDSFMPDGLSGRLNFISSVDGVRYVQVAVRCTLSLRKLLASLAHELQHALEIATNPEIADADSMESYYEGIGFQTHVVGVQRSFETEAAIMMQRRVDQEANDKSSRSDETTTSQDGAAR